MKRIIAASAGVALALVAFFGGISRAGEKETDDKTLSPYFFVKSDDPKVDQLPLKSTKVATTISGVIADVSVTQTYKNEGKRPLEAIYVFPASTRAAVYAMKMTIGSRVIEAKIKKRDEARADYEQAKQQGKSASLLEQQRPNVFQMNVANIMPGDTIAVEMKYTELLVPTDREYAFVFPTVVGPRYSNKLAAAATASDRWVANPYLHQGEAPTSTFDITVALNAGMPIQQVASPSHKVNLTSSGKDAATAALDASEAQGGNRDFILNYRLAGDQVASGLLLSKGEKENFFLMMLEPPKRVTPAQIPAREYVFIVDVSGSMHGFPLDISKTLLRDLVGNLRPTDRFNVMLFSGGQALLANESLPATQENVGKAIALIDGQEGGGGTELLPALKKALALPHARGISRTVVIATDGYVTVEEEAFDLIRTSLNKANLFAFGIGSSVNRHIIEGMAHVGMGEPFVITKPEEAQAQAAAFRQLIQSPVLTQIAVAFNGFDAYDVEPKSVPDVLADRPVIVFGKWRGDPKGTIAVRGTAGTGAYATTLDVGASAPSAANAALRYLWARKRIQLLSDYNQLRMNDERTREVTNLGLTYNLLTAYTSFIAVDNQVRNKGGDAATVQQPLPLPQGVSDYAVGGPAGMLARAASAPFPTKGIAADDARETEADEKAERTAKPAVAPPPPKTTNSVEIGDIASAGGLTSDAIRQAIQQYLPAIASCAAAGNARGKMSIELVLNVDGTVKAARAVANETKDARALQCVLRAAKAWRFPSSSVGRETTATVAIIFKA